MVRVAVVDDDAAGRAVILAHLKRYQDEHGESFSVRTYTSGVELAEGYRPELDLIFLDVVMSEMDGFEAARAIRKLDDRVVIVFVTNMARGQGLLPQQQLLPREPPARAWPRCHELRDAGR